ncbi:MAG: site-2 protease family protein [Micromonosporaceae bacterium]
MLGVPVYINASWLLLAGAVIIWYAPLARLALPTLSAVGSYLMAGAFVVCLLVSVLLHELGHALTARGFGMGVRAITLELLGGYTEMEGDSPSARADLVVSLVGPAVSALIGGVAAGVWWVLPTETVARQLAFQLAASNIIVAIFNALPGLPLDGGRALRALVWAISGDRNTGSRVAGWIGRGVAVLTGGSGLLLYASGHTTALSVIFTMLVAYTLWQGATAAIRHGRVAALLPRLNLRSLVRPVFTVPYGTPLAEAARRATEAGSSAATLGVADASGRLIALVQDQAAAAVPMERRPWVPVESVARTVEADRTLAADLTGEDVIRAVQAHPAPVYLVVSGEDVIGVLRTADLARLLNS